MPAMLSSILPRGRRFGWLLVLVTAVPLAYGIETNGSDRVLRTREFIVMGYAGLRADLQGGSGPYLRTLLDLLGTPDGQKKVVADRARALLSSYPNIMDFADQVVSLRTVTATESSPGMETVVPPPTGPGISSGTELENTLLHFTRGRAITVFLRDGRQVKGTFVDYDDRRLWLRGADRRSISLDEIIAVAEPQK